MESKNNQSALAIKYFLDNFPFDVVIGKKKPANKNEELAQKYLTLLTEVLDVFDRLIRYEKYFKSFLPLEKSGISETEAIEYHLRSYIQDFYILQERVRKITKTLIKDLPYYKNKDQKVIEAVLRHLFEQILKNLKNITSGLRREHVHDRSISELDLTSGKFLFSINSGEFPIPEGVKLEIDKIKKRYDEVVASMKEKYINQAIKNSANLTKIKEWFAARFIYAFSTLNGHKIVGLEINDDN